MIATGEDIEEIPKEEIPKEKKSPRQ